MTKRATPRQLEIVSWMLAYQAEHGMPPSLREIGAACGIRSTNGVRDTLLLLAKKGLVVHRHGVTRGWRAAEPDPTPEVEARRSSARLAMLVDAYELVRADLIRRGVRDDGITISILDDHLLGVRSELERAPATTTTETAA